MSEMTLMRYSRGPAWEPAAAARCEEAAVSGQMPRRRSGLSRVAQHLRFQGWHPGPEQPKARRSPCPVPIHSHGQERLLGRYSLPMQPRCFAVTGTA